MTLLQRTRLSLLVLATAALAGGCAAPPPPPAPPPTGLAEVMERPAERALLDGIRAYDDGQYAQAETALRKALAEGLQSARDRATAHKMLAFIACTSDRPAVCESEFRAARAADPRFTLGRSEAGHPTWGPVAQRVLN
jgi:Tfp pilus assembly protein PilF